MSMYLLGDEIEDQMPPEKVADWARTEIKNARRTQAAYLKNKKPDRADQAALAKHAIRLAYLDNVSRSLRLSNDFQTFDLEDVEDLLDMLAIVPFDALLNHNFLHLNPTFKESSELLGGAAADLITGDRLVDFKTTKSEVMQTRDLDQLLGYLLLARHARDGSLTFPVINTLSLYFCRHGHLWSLDAKTWTNNPHFQEIEGWFFRKAKELFG